MSDWAPSPVSQAANAARLRTAGSNGGTTLREIRVRSRSMSSAVSAVIWPHTSSRTGMPSSRPRTGHVVVVSRSPARPRSRIGWTCCIPTAASCRRAYAAISGTTWREHLVGRALHPGRRGWATAAKRSTSACRSGRICCPARSAWTTARCGRTSRRRCRPAGIPARRTSSARRRRGPRRSASIGGSCRSIAASRSRATPAAASPPGRSRPLPPGDPGGPPRPRRASSTSSGVGCRPAAGSRTGGGALGSSTATRTPRAGSRTGWEAC